MSNLLEQIKKTEAKLKELKKQLETPPTAEFNSFGSLTVRGHIKGNQRNEGTTIAGFQNNKNTTIGTSQYNKDATIGGSQNNQDATIGGSQFNEYTTIGDSQINEGATIRDSQFNEGLVVKGKMCFDSKTKYERGIWKIEDNGDFTEYELIPKK